MLRAEKRLLHLYRHKRDECLSGANPLSSLTLELLGNIQVKVINNIKQCVHI